MAIGSICMVETRVLIKEANPSGHHSVKVESSTAIDSKLDRSTKARDDEQHIKDLEAKVVDMLQHVKEM